MGSGPGVYKLRKQVEHSCLFFCTHYSVTSCLPSLLLLCAFHTVMAHELMEPPSLMLLSVRVSVLAMKKVVNTCVFTCKTHLKHLYKRTVNPQLPTDVARGGGIDH